MRTVITLLLAAAFVPAHAATFGDQGVYTGNHGLRDVLTLSAATPAQSGICDSITVLLKFNFDSCKIRCALYTVSGNDTVMVANGLTPERRFAPNGAFIWHGFAFPDPKPAVQAGVTYLIAVFGDTAGSGGIGLPRGSIGSAGNPFFTRTLDYESGFPNPYNPGTTSGSVRFSAYVTYTPDLHKPPRRRHITSRPHMSP